MTYHMLDEPRYNSSNPRREKRWIGRLSLLLSLTSLVLICLGDPNYSGLLTGILGGVLGGYAIRRGGDEQAAVQLGFNLALLSVVLIWPIVILVMHGVFGMDVSSLFTLPEYE